MFTKPTRRVYVTARNAHDGRSKTITLYDTDYQEVIRRIGGKDQRPGRKSTRKRRTKASVPRKDAADGSES